MSLVCLYCRSAQGPFTDEHVLQKGLGGNLKIKNVCRRCNNETLSAVDRALAECSPISFDRLMRTPNVRLGGASTVRRDDVDIEMRISDGFTPKPVPQIQAPLPWAPGPTSLSLRADTESDIAELVAIIDKRVENGTFRRTHVVAVESGLRALSLANHQGNQLRVKAETEEQGELFLRWFESVWPEYRTRLTDGEPRSEPLGSHLEIVTATRPDDYQRAIAKTALNYLCYVQGADFALRPEFDAVREYVLGSNLVVDQELLAAGEVAQDTRFVSRVSAEVGTFVPSPRHMLLVLMQGRELVAFVVFYGKHYYKVGLGTLPVGEEVFEAHEFSEDRTHNGPVPVEELMRRVHKAQYAAARIHTDAQ